MRQCHYLCPFRSGARFRGRLSMLMDPLEYVVAYDHFTQAGLHMVGIHRADAVGPTPATSLMFCTSIHHPKKPVAEQDE